MLLATLNRERKLLIETYVEHPCTTKTPSINLCLWKVAFQKELSSKHRAKQNEKFQL